MKATMCTTPQSRISSSHREQSSSLKVAAPTASGQKVIRHSDSDSTDHDDRLYIQHDYHDHGADAKGQNVNSKRSKGGVSTPFPAKLHQMLEQTEKENLSHIVSWQPHGRCFLVHRPKDFVAKVLPKYFLQKKYASFQRQVNLYGFNRITAGPDKGSYYHELFLRGKEFLCTGIHRMKVKGTGSRMPSNPDDEPDFYTMPPLSDDANESSSDKNTESTTANIPSAPIVSRDSSTYSLTNPTRNATSCVLPQVCSPSSDPYIQSQLQQTSEGKSDETEQIEDFGNIPFYPLKENESRRHSFLPHLARRLSRRLSSMGIDIPTFIASGDTNDEDMSMNVTARNSRRISRRLSSMGIDIPTLIASGDTNDEDMSMNVTARNSRRISRRLSSMGIDLSTFFSYGNENDGMNEEALVSPSIASNGGVSRQGSIILDPSADGTFAQEMEWMSHHLQNDDLSDEMLTRILERIIS